MNRRKFIRNAGFVAGGAVIAPYILPSGRLFAQTGTQLAEHVVFVMFGGGVRQQESVLGRYLEDSQQGTDGVNPGNIMFNMFEGAPPTAKIVYGTGQSGENPIPAVLGSTLQRQGTTFREVRAQTAGHYNGFVSLCQGNTLLTQGLRQKPSLPTIFEYLRKHGNVPASKVWFIGEGIGNSIPLLNHSIHKDYGVRYGANFFAPPVTFGQAGRNTFADSKIYHPEEEMPHIYRMKYFLDNYYANIGGVLDDLGNTEQEKYEIKLFMKDLYARYAGQDVISCTIEIMQRFKPTLTVFNMTGVDGCHGNFTGYLRALHRADNAVGRIWNAVQSIPEMAGKTAIIISPEHGRNLKPNPILDENDWRGYDHSDANSLRIWTQMAGPNIPANMQVGNEANPVGMSADCVPTIAEILGIKNEVVSQGYLAPGARSLFERM